MEGTPEEMIVWPPIVVLQNTMYPGMKNDQGKQDGATNARLRDLKEQCGAEKAEAVFNPDGHTGITLLRFPKTTEGYLNAVRFARHLHDTKCGKREWEYLLGLPKHRQDVWLQKSDKSLILYGWLALQEDFDNTKLNLSKRCKARVVRKCDYVQVSEDLEEMRMRAENIKKMQLETTSMKGKIKKVNAIWRGFQEKNKQQMEKYKEERERFARELQLKKEEINAEEALVVGEQRMREEAQRRQAAEKEAMEGINRRAAEKVMAQRAKLRAELEMQRAADMRALQEENARIFHEREKELNAKRQQMLEEQERQDQERLARSEQRMQEIKQKLADERARLLAQKQTQLKQLKEELEDTKEEIEDAEDTNNVLMMADRDAASAFLASHKALLKLLEDRQVNGLYVRQFGTLEDPSIKKIWNDAAEKHLKGKVSNYSAERDEIMRAATEMLENAHWMPFLNVNEKRIDHGDEFLTELRVKLGTEVEGTVIKALLELEEMNPSGRYRVPKVWHKTEDRPPTAEEIATCLTLLKPKPKRR